jgi:hypothetical protein
MPLRAFAAVVNQLFVTFKTTIGSLALPSDANAMHLNMLFPATEHCVVNA